MFGATGWVLGAVCAALVVAVVYGELIDGTGVCGITKSVSVYEGKAWSVQEFPKGDGSPIMPSPQPYAYTRVEFLPRSFTMEMRGSNYSEYAKCEFTCADSFYEKDSVHTLVIRISNATLLEGSTAPFECLEPTKIAQLDPDQTIHTLLPRNCAQDWFRDPSTPPYSFMQLFVKPWTHPGHKADASWIRNMTFLSAYQTTPSATVSMTPAPTPSQWASTTPPGPSPSPVYITPTPSVLPSLAQPWLVCPYIDEENPGFASITMHLALRAPPPVFGVPEPVYTRSGFILIMFLLVLFASGWIALFWFTRQPEIPDELKPDIEPYSDDEDAVQAAAEARAMAPGESKAGDSEEEESSEESSSDEDSEEESEEESDDDEDDDDEDDDEDDDTVGGTLTCPSCSASQPAGTAFCGSCGARVVG